MRRGKLESTDEVFRRFIAETRRAGAGPWKPDEAPLVAEWLLDSEETLRGLTRAVARARYWWPRWEPGLAQDAVPSMLAMREAGNGLAWRGGLRAGTGRGPEAADDLIACVRLGHLIARGGTLLEGLIGAAIRGTAADTITAVAPHLEPRAAKRLLDGLDALPPFPSTEWFLEADRVLKLGEVLEMRLVAARGGTRALKPYFERFVQHEAPPGLYAVDPFVVDWNELLRIVNRRYEGDLEARTTGPTEMIRSAMYLFDPTNVHLTFERTSAGMESARKALKSRAGLEALS
jgi:hypothetical protein